MKEDLVVSLTSLTFGEKCKYANGMIEVCTPQDKYLENDCGKGVIKVKKVEQFVGTEELCVIGELVSGSVALNMQANLQGQNAVVKEIESKYGGQKVAVQGARILVMLENAPKNCIKAEDALEFTAPERKKAKPGAFIIA